MGILYKDNVFAGGTIDLSKFEKKKERLDPEKLYNRYVSLLEVMSDRYNELGPQTWLNKDCSIKMIGHKDSVSDSELTSAQDDNYKNKGAERRELNPAMLTELAVTVLLQKLLPERFIVVRASNYDDYNNGVDQLILDRQTGDVICGIDEVIDRSDFNGPSKKELKIKTKMEQGGFKVKYGARCKGDKLSLESLRDVPAFYLSLNKSDLIKLSSCLEGDDNDPVEQALFVRLKESLLLQVKSYEKLSLSKPLQENIKRFQFFLEAWD